MLQLRTSLQSRTLFEIEMVRITSGEISLGLEGVARRISTLEQRVGFSNSPQLSAGEGKRVSMQQTPAAIRPLNSAHPSSVPVPSIKSPIGSQTVRGSNKLDELKKKVSQRSKISGALLHGCADRGIKDGVLVLQLESDFAAKRASSDAKTQNIITDLLPEIFPGATSVKIVGPSAIKGTIENEIPNENLGISEEISSPGILGKSNFVEANESKKLNHHEKIAKIDNSIRQQIIEKPAVKDATDVFGGKATRVDRS